MLIQQIIGAVSHRYPVRGAGWHADGFFQRRSEHRRFMSRTVFPLENRTLYAGRPHHGRDIARASDWAFLRADSAAGFCVRSDCSRYRFATARNCWPISEISSRACASEKSAMARARSGRAEQRSPATGEKQHRKCGPTGGSEAVSSSCIWAQGVLHSVESASDPLHYSRLPHCAFSHSFHPLFTEKDEEKEGVPFFSFFLDKHNL